MSAMLKVAVQDVWDTVALPLEPSQTVAQLKAEALRRVRSGKPTSAYVVKVLGATVLDEQRTLAQAGITGPVPIIVAPARRQPVR